MVFTRPMEIDQHFSGFIYNEPPAKYFLLSLQHGALAHPAGADPKPLMQALHQALDSGRIRAPPGLTPPGSPQGAKAKTNRNKMAPQAGQRLVQEEQVTARGPAIPAYPAQELTTVIMRNIPSEYTRAMFLEHLDKAGFQGSYDMVYLPINHRKGTAFGYAFVNLVSTEAAEGFMACFAGFSAWMVPSDKVAEVDWSNALQGRAAHVERYRHSPMMKPGVPDEFKPALFSQGRRVAFPGPSRGFKAPSHGKPARDQTAHGVKEARKPACLEGFEPKPYLNGLFLSPGSLCNAGILSF